jgi:hypothetical protein
MSGIIRAPPEPTHIHGIEEDAGREQRGRAPPVTTHREMRRVKTWSGAQ